MCPSTLLPPLINPLPRHGDNHLPFFMHAVKFIVYCVRKFRQRVLTSADWGEDDASESLNSCSRPGCRWVKSFDRRGCFPAQSTIRINHRYFKELIPGCACIYWRDTCVRHEKRDDFIIRLNFYRYVCMYWCMSCVRTFKLWLPWTSCVRFSLARK